MRVCIVFDELKENANNFSDYSDTLNEIKNNLIKITKDIDSKWISNNKNIYINLFNTFNNKLQVDSNKMKRYSNLILGINDNFKEKDLEYTQKINSINVQEVKYGYKND